MSILRCLKALISRRRPSVGEGPYDAALKFRVLTGKEYIEANAHMSAWGMQIEMFNRTVEALAAKNKEGNGPDK